VGMPEGVALVLRLANRRWPNGIGGGWEPEMRKARAMASL
jgi:hypothetical protein